MFADGSEPADVFAVLRLFRAKTSHHPLIHSVSSGVSARFVVSLIQDSFPFSNFDQADAVTHACHANSSQEQSPGETDSVHPQHRPDMLDGSQ
jgi:hypothetical protein